MNSQIKKKNENLSFIGEILEYLKKSSLIPSFFKDKVKIKNKNYWNNSPINQSLNVNSGFKKIRNSSEKSGFEISLNNFSNASDLESVFSFQDRINNKINEKHRESNILKRNYKTMGGNSFPKISFKKIESVEIENSQIDYSILKSNINKETDIIEENSSEAYKIIYYYIKKSQIDVSRFRHIIKNLNNENIIIPTINKKNKFEKIKSKFEYLNNSLNINKKINISNIEIDDQKDLISIDSSINKSVLTCKINKRSRILKEICSQVINDFINKNEESALINSSYLSKNEKIIKENFLLTYNEKFCQTLEIKSNPKCSIQKFNNFILNEVASKNLDIINSEVIKTTKTLNLNKNPSVIDNMSLINQFKVSKVETIKNNITDIISEVDNVDSILIKKETDSAFSFKDDSKKSSIEKLNQTLVNKKDMQEINKTENIISDKQSLIKESFLQDNNLNSQLVENKDNKNKPDIIKTEELVSNKMNLFFKSSLNSLQEIKDAHDNNLNINKNIEKETTKATETYIVNNSNIAPMVTKPKEETINPFKFKTNKNLNQPQYNLNDNIFNKEKVNFINNTQDNKFINNSLPNSYNYNNNYNQNTNNQYLTTNLEIKNNNSFFNQNNNIQNSNNNLFFQRQDTTNQIIPEINKPNQFSLDLESKQTQKFDNFNNSKNEPNKNYGFFNMKNQLEDNFLKTNNSNFFNSNNVIEAKQSFVQFPNNLNHQNLNLVSSNNQQSTIYTSNTVNNPTYNMEKTHSFYNDFNLSKDQNLNSSALDQNQSSSSYNSYFTNNQFLTNNNSNNQFSTNNSSNNPFINNVNSISNQSKSNYSTSLAKKNKNKSTRINDLIK